MIFEEYKKLISLIIDNFGEFSPDTIRGFEFSVLKNLLNQDFPTIDEFKIIMSIDDRGPKLMNANPLDAMIYMSNDMRERSRGAVQLNKIFGSTNLYNKVAKENNLEQNRTYSIHNAPFLPVENLPDNLIVGLGKPKFDLVSPSDLIYQIEIKNV